jgi:hypothetical protein
MKKALLMSILTLSILSSIKAQIYTPTGGINGITANPTSSNIGIGTNNPQSLLDVAGNVIVSDLICSGSNSWRFHSPDDGRETLHIVPRNASDTDWEWGRAFIINGENGNAVVQGKFEAKEIKVTLTPTADFVFEEDYNLPKLEEVEKHIKEKKHLPEIASAKEMEKEGVNVGEFQIKLLQKIEELTLYTIEQNNLNKEQQEKIKKLTLHIIEQNNRIKKLESKTNKN